ncbi:hypothetical protein FO519_000196 [Halicephalobus sp. NKZ332]|nr:hypothetical protein FO519_000196 [Halicephalobus sp. NKZ332]
MPPTCTICDGISDGYHFGVAACRACSSFFRRTLAENKKYKCRKSGTCNVSQNYRNVCRACRLQKCYQMGMTRQAIESLKKNTGEPNDVISPEVPSCSAPLSTNTPVGSSKHLKTFETIWKTFVSSLKSLYTVQNPSSIFSDVKASEYKLITKSEYDKVEKAAISIVFSLFVENIPPFSRISHEDRIQTLRSVTRGISMLFKAMMTSIIFPEEEEKIVMACGYYADTKKLDYFFEKSEGYESATRLVLPIIKNVRKLAKDTKDFRDLDMGTTVVLLLSQKLRQLGISSEEDEIYWKDALKEVHMEHINTFGMDQGGLKFAELLLNILSITLMYQGMQSIHYFPDEEEDRIYISYGYYISHDLDKFFNDPQKQISAKGLFTPTMDMMLQFVKKMRTLKLTETDVAVLGGIIFSQAMINLDLATEALYKFRNDLFSDYHHYLLTNYGVEESGIRSAEIFCLLLDAKTINFKIQETRAIAKIFVSDFIDHWGSAVGEP